tara:strand:- start:347 stop:577 length:231 start_codon:yes stop_codon:yes gene_type:complete
MTLFKKKKPFISYRVYMCVDEDDTESVEKYNFKWDNEYKTWYLDAHKYAESEISKQEHIKMIFTPFKVYGQHQYFL